MLKQDYKKNSYLTSLHALLNLPITISQLELALLNISYDDISIKENLINFIGNENIDLSILALEEILKNNKLDNKKFKTEFKDFNFNKKRINIKLNYLSIPDEVIHIKKPYFSNNQINKINNEKLINKPINYSELTLIKEDIINNSPKYIGPLNNQQTDFKSETYINNILNINSPLKKTGYLKEIFGFDYFNYIQSELLSICLNKTNNFVLSAPTGMGKSEIGLLCVIKSLLPNIYYNYKEDKFNILDNIINNNIHRIIYLVPMKALASQTVNYLRNKLKNINLLLKNNKDIITIEEYTGDINYLPTSNILVCTPEKFEFFLNKHIKSSKNINLIIFDEIHILGTSRGVCIERMIFNLLNNKRIIGLSATISNLQDIAKFINGKEYKFTKKDIPVDITYLNIETKYKKDLTLCNLLYNYLKQGVSILLFVNKRRECDRLAYLFLSFLEKNELKLNNSTIINSDLERIFKSYSCIYKKGIGIHNSKLSKQHRFYTEKLFKDNKFNLLISTSTLAWGINLPAQIVILYGLNYYDNSGKYVDYDIKDILQCIGRAGRRGIASLNSFSNSFLEIGNEYELFIEKKGNTSIDDNHKTLNNKERGLTEGNKNISKTNNKRKDNNNNNKRKDNKKIINNNKKIINNIPIKPSTSHCFIIGESKQLEKYKPHNFNNIILESHLLTSLADSLLVFIEENTTFEDLKQFFDTTYLKIRMLKKPELYGILKIDYNKYEDIYEVFKEYLMISCKKLEKNFCISINTLYNENKKELYNKTKYGKIASLYKIHHTTIGNLLKIKYKNNEIFNSPIKFIMFLIQNKEFLEMENISINPIQLRKYHSDISKLPNYISIEDDWDVDFIKDIEKYNSMDLLMNSKYQKYFNTSLIENKEYTQLFYKCIIIIQLIKEKLLINKTVKYNEFIIYMEFFDKNIGRIVSGLIELEEFKTKGIIYWYNILNNNNNKEVLDNFFL